MTCVKTFAIARPREARKYIEAQRHISADQLKIILGKWPEFKGFNFDAVDLYRGKDRVLVPVCCGEPLPGPSFVIVILDDVFSPDPVIVLPDKFKDRVRFESEYKEKK